MGCFSNEDENGSKPSSDEGNHGCSTTSNGATSRASTRTTTVSYPSISVSSHGQSSLEEALNVEVPFHERSVQDVTRQVADPNPSHVEEDKLIEGISSIDWDRPPIYDSYSSEDDQLEVTASLRNEGLKPCNLIVAIDFTVSNEWTGKVSFSNQSLHALGDTPNPYEQAISIIGKTLAPLGEDKLIPCFGFGDATTHDRGVFSFHNDHLPCHGFEEVLSCYKKVVPNVRLSWPTSYAPVVEAAIDIVEKSGGQYHVLLIISNGQVTRSVNTSDEELRPQENETIKSIVNASSYPLSIVLAGVGDGPWEEVKKFAEKLPARKFDNFQFVNFTEIMSKNATPFREETDFPLAALTEQQKAAMELGILGRMTGREQKIVPLPPPAPYTDPLPTQEPSNVSSTTTCPICLTEERDMAFSCGHMTCKDCGGYLSNCPMCRQPIRSRLRLFTG